MGFRQAQNYDRVCRYIYFNPVRGSTRVVVAMSIEVLPVFDVLCQHRSRGFRSCRCFESVGWGKELSVNIKEAIVWMLQNGWSSYEVGRILGKSPRTVAKHAKTCAVENKHWSVMTGWWAIRSSSCYFVQIVSLQNCTKTECWDVFGDRT